MATKVYRIGDSHESGTINLIINNRRCTEADFWEEFENQLTIITKGITNNNLEETIKQIKELLNKGSQITIGNKCFEISNK